MSEEKITCGNHGCILDSPSVGTNGGCKCINKHMTTEEIMRLKKYIYRERDKVKNLEEKLDLATRALAFWGYPSNNTKKSKFRKKQGSENDNQKSN